MNDHISSRDEKEGTVRVFLPEADEKRLAIDFIENGAIRHTAPVIIFQSARYNAFGSPSLLQQ